MKYIKENKGFTLVELLIVITLIGILAVGVLAAINPIEQFDKANDTNRKTDAAQLLNAIERYYTNMGYYPWTGGDTRETAYSGAVHIVSNVGGNAVLTTLSETGELKDSFQKRASFTSSASDYDLLHIIKPASSSDIKVCFAPKSKSMLKQASTNSALYSAQSSDVVTAPSSTTTTSTDNAEKLYWICMPE